MNAAALRLGVNIDHVATIRNARGGDHPDPVRAAQIVAAVGGDGITAHLREDRRHIRDGDLKRIQQATDLPLNLEMAATDEMLAIALAHQPHAACIVPRNGRSGRPRADWMRPACTTSWRPSWGLVDAGIRVSLFIEAEERQLEAAIRLRARTVVEFHTGEYAHACLDDERANWSGIERKARADRRHGGAGDEERDRTRRATASPTRTCSRSPPFPSSRN